MRKFLLLLPFLASTAFAGECIRYSQMDRFTANSSTELVIHTFHDGSYNMSVFPCFGLHSADRIGFSSWSSFEVCAHDTLLTADFSGHVTDRCRISSITKQ